MKKIKRLAINTAKFQHMTVSELRRFTLKYYLENLKGKRVALQNCVQIKEVLLTRRAGRKISKGGPMYRAKAAVIKHLEVLIANSTYNNWGEKKDTDSDNVLGFLNFKAKIIVDGKERHLRIAIVLTKNRATELKSIDLGRA